MNEQASEIGAFLVRHPEIDTLRRSWSYGVLETSLHDAGGDHVCIEDDEAAKVCWDPPEALGSFLRSEVDARTPERTDLVLLFVTGGGERIQEVALRLPDATFAPAVATRPRSMRSSPRPGWDPERSRRAKTPRWKAFAALPPATGVDLGPLAAATIRKVETLAPHAIEIEWSIDADDDVDEEIAHMVCLHDGSWRCSAPELEEGWRYLLDHYVELDHLAPRPDASSYAIVHHVRLEDGGAGEGSGGTGDWALTVFRVDSESLVRLATIVLGEIAWEHRSREVGGDDVRHWRVVARAHASARPSSVDCLSFDPPETFVGTADGSFVATRGSPRLGRVHVIAAPDSVAFARLDRGWPGELARPEDAWTTEPEDRSAAPRREPAATSDARTDASSDAETSREDSEALGPSVTVVDWSGTWRIEADRLVRTSPASCASP